MPSKRKLKPRVLPINGLLEVWEYHHRNLYAKRVLCFHCAKKRVKAEPSASSSSYGHGAKGRYTGWSPRSRPVSHRVVDSVSLNERVQREDCGYKVRGKTGQQLIGALNASYWLVKSRR